MTIAEKLITIADNTLLVAAAVNAKKGKNLFNKNATQYSGNVYTTSAVVNGDLVVTVKDATNNYRSANFMIPNGVDLVGKKLTVSGQWEESGSNKGAATLIWAGKDNIHTSALRIGGISTSGASATYTIPAKPENAGELCLFLYGNTEGAAVNGDTVTYRNIQVEIGEAPTAYEDYKDPQLYEEALEKAQEIKTAMLTLKEEIDNV